MRKSTLLLSMLFLFQSAFLIAQSVDDYVLEVRGDTLVVKDDFDMGEQNTLYNILQADTEAPAGRVYMLHSWGYYSDVNSPSTPNDRAITIVGEDLSSIKTNKDSEYAIPVISGANWEGGSSTGGMTSNFSLTVKGVNLAMGNAGGGQGWNWFGGAAGARIVVDNCIMEHTLWVWFNPAENMDLFIKNSYFVNLSGHTCRRNGGVIDMFNNIDTIMVENCTHVMTQGYMYKSRNYNINRFSFNHNTFVNCSGLLYLNLGSQGNMSVVNSMFINSNIQGFTGNVDIDPGESDPDGLAMGLINVRADSVFLASEKRVYVDKNMAYWDPTFDDYISTLNANAVNNITDWKDCMITMNERTQSMFDNDTEYPYLVEADWIDPEMPNFADPKDLFTDQLAVIKAFSLATVDTTSTSPLADWRLINDPVEYPTYADWPIPVDLSYDNPKLVTAAMAGLPVGDLNWFPAEYQTWLAQRDTEYSNIHETMQTGIPVAVEDDAAIANGYQLEQNYPNPFNPTTVISYKLAKAGNVTLKVYNSLGQEISTLVDGFQAAQTYKVNFDATSLSSGVYFYTLSADNFVQSKKMVLMK